MKIKNLSLGLKIGIIMAFIPLIAAILDFFTFCGAGANTGEGCGLILIIISMPFFWLASILLYPFEFLFDYFGISFGQWGFHITYTPILMVIYFLIGWLIGKIIFIVKKNKKEGAGT